MDELEDQLRKWCRDDFEDLRPNDEEETPMTPVTASVTPINYKPKPKPKPAALRQNMKPVTEIADLRFVDKVTSCDASIRRMDRRCCNENGIQGRSAAHPR